MVLLSVRAHADVSWKESMGARLMNLAAHGHSWKINTMSEGWGRNRGARLRKCSSLIVILPASEEELSDCRKREDFMLSGAPCFYYTPFDKMTGHRAM